MNTTRVIVRVPMILTFEVPDTWTFKDVYEFAEQRYDHADCHEFEWPSFSDCDIEW